MEDIKGLYQKMTQVMDRQTSPPMLEDFASFRDDINKVWDSVKEINERTFEVASPWHAAIVCMDLMASLASGEPLDETRHDITDVSQLKSLPAMQYAFRGEGNCSYPLCPSIYRKHNDGRRPELGRAMNNFAAMLKNASDYCFAIDSGRQNLAIELFVGAAQHYRLSTPMMDWTTDPCVAVAFAADYDPKEHLSVVYALPMFRAVQHNATFYLPPPFVERLYLQRGFFIETKEKKDDEALQESCIRILFKEDKAFKVIRNGAEIADLMKPFPALDALALHAKELAKNGTQLINDDVKTPEEADRILTDEWSKVGGIPDFLQADMGEQHAEAWREYILEMIERISHLRTKEGLKVNKFILQPVVCTNKQMMIAFQKWLEIQEKWAREEAKNEDAARGWGDLAKLLKELLSECK